MSDDNVVGEILYTSKKIQLDVSRGRMSFGDDKVQYFIPTIIGLTDIDFLRLIAENILIEEDCKIVMNFLDQVEALAEVNEHQLNDAVADKLKRIFGDL